MVGAAGGSAVPWRWRSGGLVPAGWGRGALAVPHIGDPWVLAGLTDPVAFVLAYVTAKQE